MKRGPKPKPAEELRKTRIYRHAPDVIKILAKIPKGSRAPWVDRAIRFYSDMEKRRKATQNAYTNNVP